MEKEAEREIGMKLFGKRKIGTHAMIIRNNVCECLDVNLLIND